MNGDDITKWLPVVISVISLIVTLIVTYLGHKLKKEEVTSNSANKEVDTMSKFNQDMRNELDRKDKIEAGLEKIIRDRDATIATLEAQVERLQTKLIDCLTDRKRNEV